MGGYNTFVNMIPHELSPFCCSYVYYRYIQDAVQYKNDNSKWSRSLGAIAYNQLMGDHVKYDSPEAALGRRLGGGHAYLQAKAWVNESGLYKLNLPTKTIDEIKGQLELQLNKLIMEADEKQNPIQAPTNRLKMNIQPVKNV